MAEYATFGKYLAILTDGTDLVQVHAFYQAAKVNGRWAYSPFRRRPIGPFHPANKAALLCVTRSGLLRLLYQNPDSKWAEISAELKNTGYSDRLLTHAAVVATQGSSSTRRLRDVLTMPQEESSSPPTLCARRSVSIGSRSLGILLNGILVS